ICMRDAREENSSSTFETRTIAPVSLELRKLTMHTPTHDRDGAPNYRKTATTIGVIYLAGMVVGVGGSAIIQSILGACDRLAAVAANRTLLAIGALLWLLAVAG